MKQWEKTITTLMKKEVCFGIIRKLYYQGKTSTKDLSAKNNTYLQQEAKKLRKMGLVHTTKKFGTHYEHELTNLGKTIFRLLSGEFEDIKPNMNFSGVVQKKPLFVGREEEIKEILYDLKRKRGFLVLGERGMGKTHLLNYLAKNHLKNAVFCKPKTPKTILVALAESFSIEIKRKTQMQLSKEVKKALENSKEMPILIIDNAHTTPPRSVETLTELSRLGVVFLAAARYTPEHYEFKKSLRLKRLTKEESSKLARDLLEKSLGMAQEDLINTIVRKTGGVPEKIAEKCKEVEVGAEVGDFDPKNKQQRQDFAEGLEDDRPIVNIGKNFFMKLAYFLLSIKFFLYMKRDYKTGYVFAMTAYLIFTMFRYWGKKKKRRSP